MADAREWTCFHCGEVLTDRWLARDHFGFDESGDPACRIKVSERGLVGALRRAEADAADAWDKLHSESTDAVKAYHAQHARHLQQLREIEEAAYCRGVEDARKGASNG